MFAYQHKTAYWDEVYWWVALAVAGLLAVVIVTQTAGGEMPPLFAPPLSQDEPRSANPIEVPPSLQLWAVLQQHEEGRLEEAIGTWMQMDLPQETSHWKHIAMAAAHLERGELSAAAKSLDAAYDLGRDRALVHYYTGLLRREQANAAWNWNEELARKHARFVAYRPGSLVAPNTKGMYQLVASQELEQAIKLAPEVDRSSWLVPVIWVHGETFPPTVGDLLVALGANQFEANAHNMLATHCLDNGALQRAEEHLDAAAGLGLSYIDGYHELGREYEELGLYFPAARAYARAVTEDPGDHTAAQRALENLRKGVLKAALR